jgi:hypothetical protein
MKQICLINTREDEKGIAGKASNDRYLRMKKYIVVIWICLTATSLKGQTASELFLSLPESALLTLSETSRLDLIDLHKAGHKAEVVNQFGDSSVILHLTNDYLEIKFGNYNLQLLLLQMVNDSKIVLLIQTVCAPVCDSYLEFYTTSWRKLNGELFISPAEKSEFIKEGINPDEQKVKNALVSLDISLMQFKYDPEKKELLQYYNTPEYLNPDDRGAVALYLKGTPRVFKWNQTRFE